jgi:hypothetical protein
MASTTKQRVKKYIYLCESVSFRDEWGRPRNKKTKIGKIDPISGVTVYTQEYMERIPGLTQITLSDLYKGTERSEMLRSKF